MKKKRIRTGKYKRVSKKEQAIKGFSLQAQDEVLDEYIEKNDLQLVGDYVDEGITASTTNRPALQRLLEDVQAGKIDLIIFTKLDRWFRSVADYYDIQKILEQNDVVWRTVLEDYTTETGDGRFKVNIMLSVAQQELDRTSERIKTVFDSKIKNKQPISGSLPIGYKIGIEDGKKRVIKDENMAEAVLDLFTHFEIHQSLRATMGFINDKHDLHIPYDSCKRILSNTLYIGKYRDVDDYCAPYLTKKRFDRIQKILSETKQVKKYKHTYLFSGLIRCPECGGSTAGCFAKGQRGLKTHYYYRCSRAHTQLTCNYKPRIAEQFVEKYLVENIEKKLEKYIRKIEVEAVEPKKPKYNKNKIKAEIDRLNKMYQKGRIEDDDYDREYDVLNYKLSQCEEKQEERDLKYLKSFLESDFKIIYKSLTKEEQRSMWRSIIKKMIVHDYDNIDIDFL